MLHHLDTDCKSEAFTNIFLIVGQCRRRFPNINPALDKRLQSVGSSWTRQMVNHRFPSKSDPLFSVINRNAEILIFPRISSFSRYLWKCIPREKSCFNIPKGFKPSLRHCYKLATKWPMQEMKLFSVKMRSAASLNNFFWYSNIKIFTIHT